MEQNRWDFLFFDRKMSKIKSAQLFLLLIISASIIFQYSEAGKRRVSIPDDLEDVIDDEEDEAWKQWGQKSSNKNNENRNEFKPPDLSKMNPAEIQAEMMKMHVGPAYGFVKLKLGVSRTKYNAKLLHSRSAIYRQAIVKKLGTALPNGEEVPEIAMRWSKVLRTGSVEAKFMAVDLATIMFTIEKGQDVEELKEFVLGQPEAYEVKLGEQTFRRPGDPPLEQVIEMLHKKKSEDSYQPKDDL